MRLRILVAASVALAGAAEAQERDSSRVRAVLERAGISGSVRVAYWSSDRDLTASEHFAASALWLKATRRLGGTFAYFAEGWAAGDVHAGETRTTAELREAYVEARAGDIDLRVGRQIFAWGRADGINPTDRLSPKDLRTLAPNDDDRRLGVDAARATWYTGSVAVSAIWLPLFRANRIGLPAEFSGAVEDREEWIGDSWAARVERTGGAVDWSVSYASVRDVGPDLVSFNGPAGPGIELAHHPLRVVGADLAGNIGHYGLRGEAAYLHTIDREGIDPTVKNRELSFVGGADRTFAGTVNLNVQYVFKYVFGRVGSAAPGTIERQQGVLSGQSARVQHGASLRLGAKWFHETFEADLSGAGYFRPRGIVVRPKISYALSDPLRVTAGSEIYRGDDTALFGLMRRNSSGFVEVRFTF